MSEPRVEYSIEYDSCEQSPRHGKLAIPHTTIDVMG
jgi:hypothetical protein